MYKLDYKKYEYLKIGQMLSVGMIDEHYVMEILTGPTCIPEFFPISKEEFDSFDEWKGDCKFIVEEIKNRECVASARRIQ